MKQNSEKFWQICSLILAMIVVVLTVCIVIGNKGDTSERETTTPEQPNLFMNFKLSEEFIGDGNIENLEDVIWSGAKLSQEQGKCKASMIILKTNEGKKIEAKELTIKLLDKDGNVIASKDTKMKEFSENSIYSNLDVQFDMSDYHIIYDIKITAK